MSNLKNKFLATTILAAMSIALGCGQSTQTSKESDSTAVDTVTILQTADLHGQLEVHDELFRENGGITFRKLGGVAHIRSLFDSVRTESPNTVILDGGDMIQGGAVAALSEGAAMAPLVRAMGYDFLTPGNWEVVYGKEAMEKVISNYKTPFISANMWDSATGGLIYPPYYVKELAGMKFGFIAYDDPEIPVRQNPEFSRGLKFTKLEHNIRALIAELKDEQDVDEIFLVTHLGISKQVYLADQPMVKGVSYILGNDTHERIRKPIQGKYAKVVEPGAFGSFVGRLDLHVKDGKIIGEHYQMMEVDPEKYPANTEVAEQLEKVKAPYKERINEVLGYTTEPLYRYMVTENPMDNMITDAAKWKTGVDIALSNGFRFSPPLVPEEGEKAPITREYLWSMLPVNEKIKTGKATGAQIKDWLESELHNVFAQNPMDRFGGWLVRFSGMELTFKASNPDGQRVQEIRINGEPMDPDQYYTLSACRRTGEPKTTLCRMPNVKDPQVKDYTIHQAVADYLEQKGTVSPTVEGRVKVLDREGMVFSQLPGTDYEFK